jgi:hypothetical protein
MSRKMRREGERKRTNTSSTFVNKSIFTKRVEEFILIKSILGTYFGGTI